MCILGHPTVYQIWNPFICLRRGKMHKCFPPIYNTSTDIVSISEEGYSCIFIGNCSECFVEKSKPVASSQTTLFFPSNSYIVRGDDIRNLLHRCIPPLQLHHHREIIEKMLINILGNFASFHINLFSFQYVHGATWKNSDPI